MDKKTKLKLSTLFIVGLSVIIITLTILLSYTSLTSLKQLGKYAVKVNEKNIKDTATLLFMEITNRTASGYSSFFKNTENEVSLLADQTTKKLSNSKGVVNSKNIKVNLEKFDDYISEIPSSENSFYIDPGYNDRQALIYWGNEKDLPKAEKNLDRIYDWFFPFADTLLQLNKMFFFSVWMLKPDDNYIIFNTFEFMSKDTELNYYRKIPGRKYLQDHFNELLRKSCSNNNSPAWIRPYKSMNDNLLLSVALPIFDKNKSVKAVVGIDINLDKVLETLAKARMLNEKKISSTKEWEVIYNEMDGFTFILDKNANLILFPENELSDFQFNSKEWEKLNLKDSQNREIADFAEKLTRIPFGIDKLTINGIKDIIAFNTIESTGWTLCFVTHENALLSAIKQTEEKLSATIKYITVRILIISIFFLIATILVIVIFFRKYLFSPLSEIRGEIKKFGSGIFDISLKKAKTQEIAELSDAFSYLGHELKEYMNNLQKEVSARQAIETEIEIAAKMQISILPDVSLLKNYDKFCFHASLSPALDVSGDFYDFFFIDENILAFVIADVSGKGMPAAFFMAMSKVLIKNQATKFKNSPAAVLKNVNNTLSIDNKAGMFTTVFICFYNIKTGEIECANAGHEAALILNDKGKLSKFCSPKDTALGIIPNFEYSLFNKVLSSGDTLFLYTDGLVEAFSDEKKQYGELRLYNILKENYSKPVKELSELIIDDVKSFENGKRSDDITLVVLRRN